MYNLKLFFGRDEKKVKEKIKGLLKTKYVN